MDLVRGTVAQPAGTIATGAEARGKVFIIMAMQNSTVLKIVLTTAVAVGGVVFFVKTTLGNTQEYMMVDELLVGERLNGNARRKTRAVSCTCPASSVRAPHAIVNAKARKIALPFVPPIL